MASGTSPPAAEEVLRTTKEKANFQRLTRLLMRGGLALLREVFGSIHPLGSLSAVLGANKVHLKNLTTPTGNKVFSYAERKCLYDPHGPGTYGKSAEFDISLLYKLLRSICSLPAPVTGWDKLPNSTDHSREADIVRIRCYRNKIYSHDRLMQVTDADFEKLWMDISEALLRIAGGISSAKREDWKKAIEKFFHAPLTPDAEECVDELQFWYLMDMETKHTLDQMQLKQAEMQKQLEQLQSTLDIFIAAIQQEPITSSNSVLEVEGAQSPSESVETRISIPQEQPSAEGTAGQSTSTELQASQQNNTEVQNFWDDVYLSKRSLNRLKKYLKKKFGANVQGDRRGSLIITVSCSSLEVLEELWKEYRTGHLNEVIQTTLVTAEVLEKLNLKEVKLRTMISEEDYLSYKEFLNKSSEKGEETIPIHQAQGSPAKELVKAKVEKPISLTKPVSHQQLANLSKGLGSNWRKLGSLLGIPEQRLEKLSSTNKLEHNKGKKMLYEWKKTIDGAATKDLQEKLKKMGMGHLLKLDKGKPKTRQVTEVSIPTPTQGTQETQQKRKHRRAPAQLVSYWLIYHLAKDLGQNWRDLGRILGIPEQELEDIDIKIEDLHQKGRAMLVEWKEGRGDNATTEVLQEALAELEMDHLLTSAGIPEPRELHVDECSVPKPAPGEGKVTIRQVQGTPTMELVEGKTVSTPSRTEPTTAEFLAGEGKMTIPQVQGTPTMEFAEAKEKVLDTRSRETKPVSRSLLRHLAADLGTKWRELGKFLGLAYSQLEYLEIKYLSLSDKGNAMLDEWKRLNGDDATMEVLQEALTKIDMGHLMEKAEGKIVSTPSRTEPTTAEFLAGPTHGKPSQVVKGDYIARSGYVLRINNRPITRNPFELERSEKGVFAAEFGFTTREDIHLTTSDMLKALTDTAQRDFSSNDCFCCIIRSTGTEHGICGTDDKPIDIKTITSLFTSDKCPSLDGKPKIFVLKPTHQLFSVLDYEPDIEARSMLQHLVISEKDFLVWNLSAAGPSYYMPFLVGDYWLDCLSMGMHLREAIAAGTGGIEQPLSLLSTLEKNVFFKRNTVV